MPAPTSPNPPAAPPRARAAAWLRSGLGAAALCVTLGMACDARAVGFPESVLRELAAAGVPQGSMAAVAMPLGQPGQRWEWQGSRPMQPASTMKVITAAVALDRLGGGFRGRTDVLAAGRIDGEVLHGDLVFRGGGDADLDIKAVERLMATVRRSGIARITGDVLLDRSLFEPTRTDQSAPPFDQHPEFAYNVVPDALQFAENLVQLQIQSDAERVQAHLDVPLPGVQIDSQMSTVRTRCEQWNELWLPAAVADDGKTLRITLNGRFPASCSAAPRLSLIERDRLAGIVVRELWTRMGGQWDGTVREGTPAAGTPLLTLAQRHAAPLADQVFVMNKVSDNVIARLTYLQLGVPAARRKALTPPPVLPAGVTAAQAFQTLMAGAAGGGAGARNVAAASAQGIGDARLSTLASAGAGAGAGTAAAGRAALIPVAATSAAAGVSATPVPAAATPGASGATTASLPSHPAASGAASTGAATNASLAAPQPATRPSPAAPATAALAAASVRGWFTRNGISPAGLVTENGSGLSRRERITPLQLARAIDVSLRGKSGRTLMASLPVAGTDGTLRLRMRAGGAAGRARMKTGLLGNAVALAGVVPDPAERLWVVAVMINDGNAVRARGALDAFTEWVAQGGPLGLEMPETLAAPMHPGAGANQLRVRPDAYLRKPR